MHVAHYVPNAALDGRTLFIRDLASALPDMRHSLLTSLPGAEHADPRTDLTLAAFGVGTYYLGYRKLRQRHLRSLEVTHLILYDTDERFLYGKRWPCQTIPTLYYGYRAVNHEVAARCSAVAVSRPELMEGHDYFHIPPGIDRNEFKKYRHAGKPADGRRGVSLLAGSKDTFNARLGLHLMHTLDPQWWLLLLSNMPTATSHMGYAMAVEKAKEKKLLALCEFKIGVAPYYLSFASVHVSNGCQRLDAEAGMCGLPIVDGKRKPKEVIADIQRVAKDPDYRDLLVQASSKLADACDLRVNCTKVRNILRACT
jgi:hypothetical protein